MADAESKPILTEVSADGELLLSMWNEVEVVIARILGQVEVHVVRQLKGVWRET